LKALAVFDPFDTRKPALLPLCYPTPRDLSIAASIDASTFVAASSPMPGRTWLRSSRAPERRPPLLGPTLGNVNQAL